MAAQPKTIWTIGHSTRSLDEFLGLLRAFGIDCLADVRNFPGSRRFPWFNKEALERALPEAGLAYVHFKDLGGRRKPVPGSHNTAWRVEAFRGYADYMETQPFQTALKELEARASRQNTAYMCSEAVWWSCHRALLSDALKVRGWTVCHIMSADKVVEHPYTAPARVEGGKLSYRQPDLFG